MVTVHSLEDLGQSELTKPLSDSAYIKIQNDGSFSLLLRQGSADLKLEGFAKPECIKLTAGRLPLIP